MAHGLCRNTSFWSFCNQWRHIVYQPGLFITMSSALLFNLALDRLLSLPLSWKSIMHLKYMIFFLCPLLKSRIILWTNRYYNMYINKYSSTLVHKLDYFCNSGYKLRWTRTKSNSIGRFSVNLIRKFEVLTQFCLQPES